MSKHPVLTWLALLALLALTAGTALLPLGAWNSIINLAVAAAKAGLVAWVYMRLGDSHALIRLTAITGLMMLVLLFCLAASDYATRLIQPAAVQKPHTLAPRL